MSGLDLSGRVALVTGASGGIGAALSRRLAESGVDVAVHFSGNREAAERVAEGVVAAGARAALLQADLAQTIACEALVAEAEAALGPIDLLVANAGSGSRGTWEDVDAQAFDAMLAVNVRAPYLLARRCLPGMVERGFGRILFTSSVAALTGGVIGPHYAASKAALHGLTHHLAARVASDGVTVNAIAPALIAETGMLPGEPEELAAKIPARRLGTPEEVADLMLAMLRNGYLTSKVVGIDGGMYPR